MTHSRENCQKLHFHIEKSGLVAILHLEQVNSLQKSQKNLMAENMRAFPLDGLTDKQKVRAGFIRKRR